jgi:signal peptidase II
VKAQAPARLPGVLIWVTAAVIIALDQWAKAWALDTLTDGKIRALVLAPQLIDFVFVRNTHGAYGLFGDSPIFLIGLSLVAFLVIFFSFRARALHSHFISLSLGLVLGGAIGNIVDRIHYHFVVDFIRIIPLPIFEVFNIADTAISVGIVLIILASLMRKEVTPET